MRCLIVLFPLIAAIICSCKAGGKNGGGEKNIILQDSSPLVCGGDNMILSTEGIDGMVLKDTGEYNYFIPITSDKISFKVKASNIGGDWWIEKIQIKKKSDKSFKVLYSISLSGGKNLTYYSGWYHLVVGSNVLECNIFRNESNENRTINIIMCSGDVARSIVINQSK